MSNLQVGDVLYGYCGGWFGETYQTERRIEAVGRDWVVCRTPSGDLEVAYEIGGNIHSALAEYLKPPEDDIEE